LVVAVRVTAMAVAVVIAILRRSAVAAAIAVVVRARHDDVPRVGHIPQVGVVAIPVGIGVGPRRGVIGVGIAVAITRPVAIGVTIAVPISITRPVAWIDLDAWLRASRSQFRQAERVLGGAARRCGKHRSANQGCSCAPYHFAALLEE